MRLDPWAPEYDGALGLAEGEAPAARVELDVEPGGWRALPPAAGPVRSLAFVDGVRRIEHRLHVESAGASFHGLLGSFAVGAVAVAERARIVEARVRRLACVGGGLRLDPLEIRVGRTRLLFEPEPVPENAPLSPLQGLQTAMRRAEAALGQALEADLVVLDGPLAYAEAAVGPLVGCVKRLQQRYLPPEREDLLPRLSIGERSPLFLILDPSGRHARYSCYVRLGRGRPIESALAGLARLELPGAPGLAAARRAADVAAAHLPRFASDAPRDPRAPQNLYPVGGLESELRRRLGDALVIRRAIEALLMREVA